MKLFRLVNKNFDPVNPGAKITRISNKSHQKNGAGMYFADSKESALAFHQCRPDHGYTHLLKCNIPDIKENDIVDLVTNPNRIPIDHPVTFKETCEKYCHKNGKKGVRWASKGKKSWIEYVILEPFIGDGFEILNSENL